MEHPAPTGSDFSLPVGVGLLGVLVSLLFWGLLVGERRSQILDSTAEAAAVGRAAIERDFARQLRAMQSLAQLWSDFGLRPSEEWDENVGERVGRIPGLVAITWIDRSARRQRVAVDDASRSEVGTVEPEQVRRALGRKPRLEGPELLPSGVLGYRIFLPVHGEDAGTLVGAVEIEPFVRAALEGTAPGFAITARWDAREVFAVGRPSEDDWQDWWRVEESVVPALGPPWQLEYRPTTELAALRLSPIPHYLLGAGILLSIVMAFATYELRVIRRQSHFLSAANQALERRGEELEGEVAARTAELREAVVELEAFNHSVSHDLRSPLGAILNFVAILQEDYTDQPLDEQGRAHLERIRRSATRATQLLEDLLQLSRTGRAALSFEPLDMTRLAKETFNQVRAAENDFDVEFVAAPLPKGRADRTLIGTVFANLFGNAFKYSRGVANRRISVSGRVEGDECIYVVSDNGHGFDMRFADKVFGLFERLHRGEQIEGTGIGLAMVARIVQRHGGRVWAEAKPGEGASFYFTLPRSRS